VSYSLKWTEVAECTPSVPDLWIRIVARKMVVRKSEETTGGAAMGGVHDL
jgi:hypothetical protein